MEPLDPKLARLVHEGMVQAVPGPEVEARVLQGLLARLPAGPPAGDGGERLGGDGPGGAGEQAGLAESGASATAAGAGKAWVLVAVLGGAAVIGGAWVGGRPRAPEPSATTVEASEEHHSGGAGRAASREALAPVEPDVPPSPGPAVSDPTTAVPSSPSSDEAVAVPSSSGEPVAVPSPPGDPLAVPSRATSREPTTAPSPSSDRPAPAPTGPSPAAEALADEIRRIAAADAALARGDAEQALRLARAHARAHPQGQLAVERTAIELGARCQLGLAGASEAAAAFLRTHGRVPAAATVRTRCAVPDPPLRKSTEP